MCGSKMAEFYWIRRLDLEFYRYFIRSDFWLLDPEIIDVVRLAFLYLFGVDFFINYDKDFYFSFLRSSSASVNFLVFAAKSFAFACGTYCWCASGLVAC